MPSSKSVTGVRAIRGIRITTAPIAAPMPRATGSRDVVAPTWRGVCPTLEDNL
jgi:hypothetical protein